jgi:hypothetical protein
LRGNCYPAQSGKEFRRASPRQYRLGMQQLTLPLLMSITLIGTPELAMALASPF